VYINPELQKRIRRAGSNYLFEEAGVLLAVNINPVNKSGQARGYF
jgi:hypothetical protein